jgi:Ca-activated chloride channel family protein
MIVHRLTLLALLLATPAPLLADDDDEDRFDREDQEEEEEEDLGAAPVPRGVVYKPRAEIDFEGFDIQGRVASPMIDYQLVPDSSISATVGGAQDARFLDRQLEQDIIPRPEHFTAEGILSEHDLPVAEEEGCEELLCAAGEAVLLDDHRRLLAQPRVDAIAQIGFATGLDPETWQRPPLHIVAVVDTSGSMQGEALATTKAALRLLVRRMEPGDRMSVVRFDTRAQIVEREGEREDLLWAIDHLQADGRTCLACGLELGGELALRAARDFEGLSRIVVFTDEQPNVGTTSAAGFVRQLEALAADEIGVTTIGVASHFGVELAQAVSTVRGANLYYFEDLGEMRRVFDEELDTMLVPIAYELELEVQPARGWELAGVYGLPGERLDWTRDGGMRLEVATLFPSRDKGGGIFLGFERSGRPVSSEVASVQVRYRTVEGRSPRSELSLPVVPWDEAAMGLRRGLLLVDEITTLKAATLAHHEDGDDLRAWRLLRDLEQRLDAERDPELRAEWRRVAELQALLEPLVPASERSLSRRDPISGLPPR